MHGHVSGLETSPAQQENTAGQQARLLYNRVAPDPSSLQASINGARPNIDSKAKQSSPTQDISRAPRQSTAQQQQPNHSTVRTAELQTSAVQPGASRAADDKPETAHWASKRLHPTHSGITTLHLDHALSSGLSTRAPPDDTARLKQATSRLPLDDSRYDASQHGDKATPLLAASSSRARQLGSSQPPKPPLPPQKSPQLHPSALQAAAQTSISKNAPGVRGQAGVRNTRSTSTPKTLVAAPRRAKQNHRLPEDGLQEGWSSRRTAIMVCIHHNVVKFSCSFDS